MEMSVLKIVVVKSPCHVCLCDPMGFSTPGLPVPQHVLEFAQSSGSLHHCKIIKCYLQN